MQLILGIEFGSTRIKTVATDEHGKIIATGSHSWENTLTDGIWSYPTDEIKAGLQKSYAAMCRDLGYRPRQIDAMGISAMMHGYLALDKDHRLLVPFRTWRNTCAAAEAQLLSDRFGTGIPPRWSCAHLLRAARLGEDHLPHLRYLTTLAGYIHYLLCGRDVLGIGDASGMFPMCGDSYDPKLVIIFEELLTECGYDIDLLSILPPPLPAGSTAGYLTEAGAHLLDPTGTLASGTPLCPPEGDMQTGMVATNCIAPGDANLSAGTSANLTVMLSAPLARRYYGIDTVLSPCGTPAALLHTNNCTSELNAWADMIGEAVSLCGTTIERGKLLDILMAEAERSCTDGGIAGYNHTSGEPQAGTQHGAPMVVRREGARLTLADFMQMQIYSALAAVAMGAEALCRDGIKIEKLTAHGGFYKAPRVGSAATSAMLGGIPVTVNSASDAGGAWGIALLACTVARGCSIGELMREVFADTDGQTLTATDEEIKKCRAYMALHKKYLPAARLAGNEDDDDARK